MDTLRTAALTGRLSAVKEPHAATKTHGAPRKPVPASNRFIYLDSSSDEEEFEYDTNPLPTTYPIAVVGVTEPTSLPKKRSVRRVHFANDEPDCYGPQRNRNQRAQIYEMMRLLVILTWKRRKLLRPLMSSSPTGWRRSAAPTRGVQQAWDVALARSQRKHASIMGWLGKQQWRGERWWGTVLNNKPVRKFKKKMKKWKTKQKKKAKKKNKNIKKSKIK